MYKKLLCLLLAMICSPALAETGLMWYGQPDLKNPGEDQLLAGYLDKESMYYGKREVTAVSPNVSSSAYTIRSNGDLNGLVFLEPHKSNTNTFSLYLCDEKSTTLLYDDVYIENLHEVLAYDGQFLYYCTDYLYPVDYSCDKKRMNMLTKEVYEYDSSWTYCNFSPSGNIAGKLSATIQYQVMGQDAQLVVSPSHYRNKYASTIYSGFEDNACWLNDEVFLFWGCNSFYSDPIELEYDETGYFSSNRERYTTCHLLYCNVRTGEWGPYLSEEGEEIIIYNYWPENYMSVSPDGKSLAVWLRPRLESKHIISCVEVEHLNCTVAVLSLVNGKFTDVFAAAPQPEPIPLVWID